MFTSQWLNTGVGVAQSI